MPVTALKPTPSNPATADKPKYARWKDAFKSGVGLYMSEEYEKAVEAFNEVRLPAFELLCSVGPRLRPDASSLSS